MSIYLLCLLCLLCLLYLLYLLYLLMNHTISDSKFIIPFLLSLNHIDLLNINVYLSNILLLPSIYFIYLIQHNVQKWDSKIHKYKTTFLYFLYAILVIFIIGIFISTIHHIFMFSDYTSIIEFGNIDYKITAPLITFTILVLVLIYSIYNYYCTNHKQRHIYNPIFITGITLCILGFLVYLYRRNRLPNRTTAEAKYIYIILHILFHYLTYTGILLIILLYYFQYENIYKVMFEDKNYCKKKV